MLALSLTILLGCCQILWLSEISFPLLSICNFSCLLLLALYCKFNNKLLRFLFAFCLGFSVALIHGYYLKSTQLKLIPQQTLKVKGKIIGLPIEKSDKVKFQLVLADNELAVKKVLAIWYKQTPDQTFQFRTGQEWLFELKLKPNHHNFNLGSYDYSKWLFRNRIDALATIKSAEFIEQGSFDFISWIHQARYQISLIIEENIESSRVQALIKAITIGDKSQISYQDSLLFRQTGTAHIIAISGLHIGLIAFIGVLLGRLMFLLFTSEKINRIVYEVVFSFSLALFYTLLAGFSISTVRALIMLSVFLLSYLFKRPINRWQAWSVALILVILIDPLNVLDAGFWLSFSAVIILIMIFSGKRAISNKLLAFVKAQLVLLIGLLPLSVLVFGNINLLTPISNFIVLPLASILMIPIIFLSLITQFFSGSLTKVLFELSEFICLQFFRILDLLSQIDYLNFSVNSSASLMANVFMLTLMSLILLLPKIFRWKYVALILLLPLFFKNIKPLNPDEFVVNVLDVGQGLSVVVSTGEHNLIYDTGAKFDSGFSMSNSVVIPFLQQNNIQKIDKLILSHKDNDHAGGRDELIDAFKDIDVYSVDGEDQTCDSKISWSWDGVLFEVLSPYEIIPYLGNNSSCVLRISNSNHSILLTGDIEEPVEYRLIHQKTKSIQSDVLLVPHHGSRSSSSLDFIQKVKPTMAINSSGFANQFRHPHPLVQQRYLDQGIEFYDTQKSGMIKLEFKQNLIELEEYKKTNSKLWFVNLE